MLDITNALSQWLLSQVNTIPEQVLRQGTALTRPERMFSWILGERETAELMALLERPAHEGPRSATVLLPGIMGSMLASIRGISAVLWPSPSIITNGQVNLLDLNEDGTADASPDVEIVATGIEKMTYLPIILALARQTRLYEFPYDWRRQMEWNASVLRSTLARWSAAEPDRRFTLVCHSMGGLVARCYTSLYPAEAEKHVDKIIMLGTPLSGSPAAALTLADESSPSSIVTHLHPGNDVVRFASGLRTVYQLLPPPRHMWTIDRPYPFGWDIYDANAWGLDVVRQDYLDGAAAMHELIAAAPSVVPQIEIAGCHRKTPTDVFLRDDDGSGSIFEVVNQDVGADSGDEQVPLWSTKARDVTSYYVEETHHGLVSGRQILEAVIALIHDEPISLPQTPPEPLPSRSPLMAIPIVQRVAELRVRMEQGQLSREDIQSILFAK